MNDDKKTNKVLMQLEEALLSTAGKYLAVLQELPDIVYKIDPDGYFTFINNSVRVLGYKPKELIGKHFRKIIHPKDVKAFGRHYVLPKYKGKVTGDKNAPKLFDERRTGKRKTKDLTIRLIPKDQKRKRERIGQVIAFGDVSCVGHYDTEVNKNEKKFLGTLGIIRDITERTKIENKLIRLSNAMKMSSDSIVISDLDGNITEVNEATLKMYGTDDKKDLIGKNSIDFIVPEEREKALSGMKEVLKKGYLKSREYNIITKDNRIIPIDMSVGLMKDTGGKPIGFVGISRDIAERKQTEAKLHYQADLLANVSDAVISTDLDFNIRTWNKAAEKMYGWEAYDVIGKPIHIVTKTKYPYDKQDDVIKHLHKNAFWRGEVIQERKDDTEIYVLASVTLIKDRSGKSIGIVTVNRDITEGKQAEKDLKSSLKEKEVLLKELHHRVKNNMQIISSLINLQTRHLKDKKAIRMFKESQDRIKSMALVHEKLYQLEDLTQIDIAGYVSELTNQIRRSHAINPKMIKLNIKVKEMFLNINTAIPCGLVINELVSNAFKYAFPVNREGEILIELFLDKDDMVTLIVKDDGIGFPEDIDFHNTETLGLQLVNTLVKQLNGAIELDRSNGTAFKIRFSESKIEKEKE
jgi:PAS domain S-box-containing protein